MMFEHPALGMRVNVKLDDGRFDWSAPRPPACEKCKGKHTGTNCAAFAGEQAERLKSNDLVSYFWHAGYRTRKEPLYDTETFRSTTPDPRAVPSAQDAPLFQGVPFSFFSSSPRPPGTPTLPPSSP